MRRLIVDTETAGLDPKDGVVEIAIIEVDDNLDTIATHYSLIDPEGPISFSASGVHGIVREDVLESPTLRQFFDMDGVRDYCTEDLMIIGHNIPFDIRFIQAGLKGNVIPVCTLRLARQVFPDAENHKLQTLRYMLDLEAGDAHSAHGDAVLCQNFMKLLSHQLQAGVDELAHLSSQPIRVRKMPFGKHKDMNLQDLPGSYISWLLKQDIDDDLRSSLEHL